MPPDLRYGTGARGGAAVGCGTAKLQGRCASSTHGQLLPREPDRREPARVALPGAQPRVIRCRCTHKKHGEHGQAPGPGQPRAPIGRTMKLDPRRRLAERACGKEAAVLPPALRALVCESEFHITTTGLDSILVFYRAGLGPGRRFFTLALSQLGFTAGNLCGHYTSPGRHSKKEIWTRGGAHEDRQACLVRIITHPLPAIDMTVHAASDQALFTLDPPSHLQRAPQMTLPCVLTPQREISRQFSWASRMAYSTSSKCTNPMWRRSQKLPLILGPSSAYIVHRSWGAKATFFRRVSSLVPLTVSGRAI